MAVGRIQNESELRNYMQSLLTTAGLTSAFVSRANSALLSGDIPVTVAGGGTAVLAFGSGTVTFSAAAISATTTVTHGLPATPQVAFAICSQNSDVVFWVHTFTSTDFGVRAENIPGVTSGTVNFVWFALS